MSESSMQQIKGTYDITSLQLYDIARNEILSLYLAGFSTAKNDGLWRSKAFKRLYRLLCLVVLRKTKQSTTCYLAERRHHLPNYNVEKDDCSDNTAFNVIIDSEAQRHGDDKNLGFTS